MTAGYMYKSGVGLMEPVALIGQNVAIRYINELHIKRVTFVEAIPPFQALDVGAVAAQTRSARTAMPNLDLADNEFGQFRWYPLDDMQVLLWLPQAQGKSVLRNIMVPMDATVVHRDPCLHLTEFFVWEDNHPFVEVINYRDYPITMARIITMGFRYRVDDVTPEVKDAILKGDMPVTNVYCSGKQL